MTLPPPVKKLLFPSLFVTLLTIGCNSSNQGTPMKRGNAFGIPSEEPTPAAPPRGPATTSGPGWDAVRKALFIADNCYGGNVEYCVKDPDFVNPLIQGVLDKWYDGVMPQDQQRIDEV